MAKKKATPAPVPLDKRAYLSQLIRQRVARLVQLIVDDCLARLFEADLTGRDAVASTNAKGILDGLVELLMTGKEWENGERVFTTEEIARRDAAASAQADAERETPKEEPANAV